MQSFNASFNSPKSIMSPRGLIANRRANTAGRNLSVNRSTTARTSQLVQVVCRTQYHVVESFGVPLPVLVTDALTFSDRSTAVSVCISDEGWAWVVCGRRLLIWRYKESTGDPGMLRHVVGNYCQELTLPRSDLAHKAELVAVFTLPGSSVPSCIAVSPEGAVRYWPSISHEGVSVEDNADLLGQECDSLTNIAPIGCIVATTTSTILLVEPQITSGRHAISCRTLKMPHGWLGGIGCKVSSLIFGSLPTSQVMETKLVKVAAVNIQEGKPGGWCVYVLAEHSLQKWVLYPGEVEKLIYECDINRIVREAFHETIWESCAGSTSELDIWMLDMQTPAEGGIMLLVAAVNKQITPQLHYALGKLSTETMVPPTKFCEFCPLKNTGFYNEENEAELLDYQFLLVRRTAYIYNQKVVVVVSAMNENDEVDVIQFVGPGDSLLGGALCGNVPVLFSKVYGLVSITAADSCAQDFINSMTYGDTGTDVSLSQFSEGVLNVTISEKDLQLLSLKEDAISRMRAAFIQYIKNKRDVTTSRGIVHDLLSPGKKPLTEVDAELDIVVLNTSKDLIDDIPASDPRWSNAKGLGLITYSSLQIVHQLEDKNMALKLYISFLKDAQLWDQLRALRCHGGIMATPHVLGEFAEKLVAAIALRKLQTSSAVIHGEIIDSAIRLLVSDDEVRDELTHQDLFYRKVSEMHKFFQALSKRASELANSDRQPTEVVKLLVEMNSIVQTILQEVVEFRQQQAEVFCVHPNSSTEKCTYIPWTSATSDGGIKQALMVQRDVARKHGSKVTGDLLLRSQLLDQIVNITDIILDGLKCQLESTRKNGVFKKSLLDAYENERYDLIHTLVTDKEYERATILAEKYCDFKILIEVCDATSNNERLNKYVEQFAEQDFSRVLYSWYISKEKQAKLLDLFRKEDRPQGQLESLTQFLENYPSLSWLLNVYTENYKKAGKTLLKLAEEEKDLLQKKKSMLSFAKLAFLASNDHLSVEMENEIDHINSELDLIAYQEYLPDTVLMSFGHSADKLRVFTPKELIQFYISDEYQRASEMEFKKALDLLAYIDDDDERKELHNSIWCQAVLRDKWTEIAVGSPIAVIQNTTFFKLVDLLIIMGGQPDEVLPPIESILENPELGSLKGSPNFQYLLKVGYEYVTRTIQDTI